MKSKTESCNICKYKIPLIVGIASIISCLAAIGVYFITKKDD